MSVVDVVPGSRVPRSSWIISGEHVIVPACTGISPCQGKLL